MPHLALSSEFARAVVSVVSCVQAVSAAAALVEGSLEDGLKKFLNKYIVKKELSDEVQGVPVNHVFAVAQEVHQVFFVRSWACWTPS
jgi:hypothetical protein